jgi:hypothetical protein
MSPNNTPAANARRAKYVHTAVRWGGNEMFSSNETDVDVTEYRYATAQSATTTVTICLGRLHVMAGV